MIDCETELYSKERVPNYELPLDKIMELTADLMCEKSAEIEKANSRLVSIELAGDSPYSDIGRCIEKKVFFDNFKNTVDQMKSEYGDYESASRFFISIDTKTQQPVGVLRIIHNSDKGLKTIEDIQKGQFKVAADTIKNHGLTDLDKVWDIGTVAVLGANREIQNELPIVNLYRAAYKSSLDNGVDYWVTIIDDAVLKMTKDRFGIPFNMFTSSKGGSNPCDYLGSESSSAVYAFVPHFRNKMGGHMLKAVEDLKSRNKFSKIQEMIYDILVEGGNDQSIIFE